MRTNHQPLTQPPQEHSLPTSTPAEASTAWTTLTAAVIAFYESDRDDLAAKKALQDAVFAYARLRDKPPQPTGLSDHRDSPFVVKFGRSKGKTLAECDTADLNWLAGAIRRSIDDPSKARFIEQNRSDLAAIEHELETR
jgi:hypothetical protein